MRTVWKVTVSSRIGERGSYYLRAATAQGAAKCGLRIALRERGGRERMWVSSMHQVCMLEN
jgi:hypothetical protein